MSYSGTVYCGYCHTKGHNKRGCPKRKEAARLNPDGLLAHQMRAERAHRSPRRCGYCKQATGHTRRTCDILKADLIEAKQINHEYRTEWLKILKEEGAGIGALVTYRDPRAYSGNPTRLGVITEIAWNAVDFRGYESSDRQRAIIVCPVKHLNHRHRGRVVCSLPRSPFWTGDTDGEKSPTLPLTVVSQAPSDTLDASCPDEWASDSEEVDEMYSASYADAPCGTATRLKEKIEKVKKK